MCTMYNKPHLYTIELAPSFSQNPGKSKTLFLPIVKINTILNNNKTKNTEFIPNKTLKASTPEILSPHWKLSEVKVVHICTLYSTSINWVRTYKTSFWHL